MIPSPNTSWWKLWSVFVLCLCISWMSNFSVYYFVNFYSCYFKYGRFWIIFVLSVFFMYFYHEQTEMTGHEARINNVMDEGRKMIEEGTEISAVLYESYMGGSGSSLIMTWNIFLLCTRSFPQRRDQAEDGWSGSPVDAVEGKCQSCFKGIFLPRKIFHEKNCYL